MCGRKLSMLLYAAALWSSLALHATYAADVKRSSSQGPSSSSSGDMPQTPQELADSLSQASQTLADESSALAAESAALTLTVNELSRKLKESQTEADGLKLSLESTRTSFAAYVTSSERAISYAEGVALNQTRRAERAEAERDFWRTGGIACAAIGIFALVISLFQ